MLRLAAFIVGIAWSTAAWAQAAEATGVAVKAADSILATGPVAGVLLLYGIVVSAVAFLLWRSKAASDDTIKELQDKRLADTASYIERISKVGTDASAAITGNNAQVADLLRLINAIYDLIKTVPPAVVSTQGDVVENGRRMEALSNFLREKLGGGK